MSPGKDLDRIRDLAQRGDIKIALAQINKMIVEHPNESEVWSLRASFYARNKNYEEALADISQAIEISPEKAIFYFHRGRYNFSSENFFDALEDFTAALEKDSYRDITFTQVLYFFRVEAFIKLGKKEEALSDISYIHDDYQTWTFKLRSKADLIEDCSKL